MAGRLERIDGLIAADRFGEACDVFEVLSEAGGLRPDDEIAIALLLMWPPLAGWNEALDHLRKALTGESRIEAAAWGAYICETLYPVTDEFHIALREHSDRAEACFLLCEQARHAGDNESAREWLHRCHQIDRFPNSIYVEWLFCTDRSISNDLLREAMDAVTDHQAELRPPPQGRADLRRRSWNELIRGEEITTLVWEDKYCNHLGRN